MKTNDRITKVHWRRNAQRGSEGDKGSRAGPRVDLPLQRYLLLPHKRAASARKSESAPSPRRRSLPSILHDHSVIHEYHLRRGKPFLSPTPPSPASCPPQASRSRHIHGEPSPPSVFCLSFLSAKPREMLPEHRKSIRAANIYYKMAAGRRGSDVGDAGACWGGHVTPDDSCAGKTSANYRRVNQDLDCVFNSSNSFFQSLYRRSIWKVVLLKLIG